MRSANKSLHDIFFLNQRTPLSDIKNQSLYLDCYEEQQQQIQILEKKLLEQQQINQQEAQEIEFLKRDVKNARDVISQTENQLVLFHQELKQKEDQLLKFEKVIRDKEMELINKELCLVNKQTQTEETILNEESEENESVKIDIDIARMLFEKRINKEYQQIQEKKQELQIRENAILFRENKIKEFLFQLQQQM